MAASANKKRCHVMLSAKGRCKRQPTESSIQSRTIYGHGCGFLECHRHDQFFSHGFKHVALQRILCPDLIELNTGIKVLLFW
jgi:hypothetical protein